MNRVADLNYNKIWIQIHKLKKNFFFNVSQNLFCIYLKNFLIYEKKVIDAYNDTVCPRSSDPFYVSTCYIKWVTTFWTYSI